MAAADRFREKTLIYRSATGLSLVWKAWDTERNCLVAVKEVVCESQGQAEDRLSEAHMQMSLFHPALCRIWDAYIEDNTAVLVLEWMDCDLDIELRRRRRESKEAVYAEAEEMAVRLIDALAYAQNAGLCHRDIKPGNLFISSTGTVKLGDFGSALVSEPLQTAYSITGTPLFLSPKLRSSYARFLEGLEEGRAAHDPYKSDVYSLGLTLLYCFTEELTKVIRLKRLEDIRTEVGRTRASQWLQEVMGTMLVVEEEQRPCFIQLRRYISSRNPGLYLPYTNAILGLSGSVWLPLLDFHVREALQGQGLVAETALLAHCKACGAEILLQGQTARREELQSEYCSQTCQLQASGSAVPVRRRILRVLKKERKVQSKPCAYCLCEQFPADQEPIPLCSQHTLCSVECLQGLSNVTSWSKDCPICLPEVASRNMLQAEISRLQQEAEEQFCLESFGTGAGTGVHLSDTVKENYSSIARALYNPMQLLSEVRAQDPALTQLLILGTIKLGRTQTFRPCTPERHGVPDNYVFFFAKSDTNHFLQPVQPRPCSNCDKPMTVQAIAAACNRIFRSSNPKMCRKCGRMEVCRLTECCGVLCCCSCHRMHTCAS